MQNLRKGVPANHTTDKRIAAATKHTEKTENSQEVSTKCGEGRISLDEERTGKSEAFTL